MVTEGLADPSKLGIFGHSFGGYIVNIAITHMSCFKAAVSSTGFTNWTSAYGAPSPSGRPDCSRFVEFAQPRMGVPPWEDPQRYVNNSPLFMLNRVVTPVLIVHGEMDLHVSQAWELFNGLQRLDKTAALTIYRGEGHAQSEWRRPNVVDFWERTLGWFDRYLIGADAPNPQ